MQGVSIFRKSIFKYKGTYLLQTDSKFAINFLFFLICILMGRGLKKWGNLSTLLFFANGRRRGWGRASLNPAMQQFTIILPINTVQKGIKRVQS